jgi:RNA polymerase sigma-70 factor (ECF subfamily)
VIREDVSKHVTESVSELPVHYRAVLTLHYLEGLSYEEIADVLNLPMGTVKTHLHRARQTLKRVMLKKFGREELI